MIVCVCKAVSDKQIAKLIEEGQVSNITDLIKKCDAGSDCGSCIFKLHKILKDDANQGAIDPKSEVG